MRITPTAIKYLLVLWSLVLISLHCYASFTGTSTLWGVDSWAYFPLCLTGVLTLVGLVFLFPPVSAGLISCFKSIFSRVKTVFRVLDGQPAAIVLAISAGSLFWLLRCRVHLLGDGYWWIRNLEKGVKFHVNEPLALYLTWLTRKFTSRFAEASTETAFQFVSVASGVVFIYLLFLLARRLGKTNGAGALIFLGLLTQGFVQLFFGYVETYPPGIAALLLYLLLAVRQLKDKKSVFWPTVAFLLCVLMHLSAVSLAPSLAYLYLHWWKSSRKSLKPRSVALVTAGPIFAVTIVLFLIGLNPVKVFSSSGVSVLPFFPFVSNSSEYFNYNFFSLLHLIDLLNLVLLVSPFCIPLCLLLVGNCKYLGSTGRFMIMASIFPLGLLAMFNPELGFPRDWDVFAQSLIPPTLLGIMTLIKVTGKDKVLLGYAGTVIIVVGLLHVVPWVLIQADGSRFLARYERLLEGKLLYSQHAQSYGHEEIAIYYRDRNRLSLAEKHYQKAIEAQPDSYRLHGGLALIYRQMGKKDKALAGMLKMVEVAPESLRAQFNLALFYQKEGKLAEAETHYKKTLEINPNHLPAVFNLAAVYFNQGLIDQAILLYQYVLERDPDDKSARKNLEKVLQVKSMLESAVDSTSPAELPPE